MARNDDWVSEKTLNEVRKMVNALSIPLHLTGWTFIVDAGEEGENPGEVARILVQDDYMQARIEVLPFYNQLGRDDREETIAHELFHAILAPMMRDSLRPNRAETKATERVTSHVTRIFLDLYRRRRRKKETV